MNGKRLALSVLVITLMLFIFGGIAQMFPWGIPTVNNVYSNSIDSDEFLGKSGDFLYHEDVKKYEQYALTTEKFDEEFKGKISTFTTDKTFSYIVSTDIKNYNPMDYFIKQIIKLLLVAILLSLVLEMTINWELKKRLFLIGLLALLGSQIYIEQMNWWHVPSLYGVGMIFNTFVSWLLSAGISACFIIKLKKNGK